MDINYKVNRAQVGDGGLSYGHKNSCFQCKFFGENLKWLENVKILTIICQFANCSHSRAVLVIKDLITIDHFSFGCCLCDHWFLTAEQFAQIYFVCFSSFEITCVRIQRKKFLKV